MIGFLRFIYAFIARFFENERQRIALLALIGACCYLTYWGVEQNFPSMEILVFRSGWEWFVASPLSLLSALLLFSNRSELPPIAFNSPEILYSIPAPVRRISLYHMALINGWIFVVISNFGCLLMPSTLFFVYYLMAFTLVVYPLWGIGVLLRQILFNDRPFWWPFVIVTVAGAVFLGYCNLMLAGKAFYLSALSGGK